jgi:DNA-binding MarR family transcriptional regulator
VGSTRAEAGAEAEAEADLVVGVALEQLGTWVRRATPRFEWNALALSVLAEVERRGPLRITDLVAAERITQPGMTSLVRRLETAHLVARRPDETDGRATLVSITPQGRAYLSGIHEARARIITEHVQWLTPEHRDALAGAVAALEALSARPLGPGGFPGAPRERRP